MATVRRGLSDFLVRLGNEPELFAEYMQDRDGVMEREGVLPADRDVILGGDLRELRARLTGGTSQSVEAWTIMRPGEEPPTIMKPDEEPPTIMEPDEEPPTIMEPDEEPPTIMEPDEPPTIMEPDEEPPTIMDPGEMKPRPASDPEAD